MLFNSDFNNLFTEKFRLNYSNVTYVKGPTTCQSIKLRTFTITSYIEAQYFLRTLMKDKNHFSFEISIGKNELFSFGFTNFFDFVSSDPLLNKSIIIHPTIFGHDFIVMNNRHEDYYKFCFLPKK